MTIPRRTFLATATAALATSALADDTARSAASAPPPSAARKPLRIGVSTYSYWHFKGDPPDIRELIVRSAELGFDGVEILHEMMPTEDNKYLQELKHIALVNGVDLMGFSIHQGFVSPDAEERRKNVEHTLKCIELAYRMGIPTMRLNTGRWKTIASFDDLMANKGIEPVLAGHTEDEGFKWCIDCIQQLLPKAQECGVCMGLENHWGLGRTAEGVMRIHDAINSPWLKLTFDTGNFLEDQYAQGERMAPHTVLVQAKTYFGGGEWYTLEIDYPRIDRMLRSAGYNGYISLEYEGKDDPATGVPRSLELFRKTFG